MKTLLRPNFRDFLVKLSTFAIPMRRAAFSLVLSGLFSIAFAQAPSIPQGPRPGDQRLPLPDYPAPKPSRPLVLPPVPPQEEQNRLSARVQVFVREFQLSGNTLFSDEELAQVTQPYEGRQITSEELQEVRRQLTLFYFNRGYINSGAVIPDQKVSEGIVRIQIIEGQLSAIKIAGNDWLRTGYLRKRLALGAKTALNLQQLQQRLQLLQQDPLLDQINAELGPGLKPGEGVLNVRVKEAKPYQGGFIFANDRPPSVGSERGRIYATHRNLTGWADSLGVWYGLTEGADDISAFYMLPLTARDTRLRLYFDKSDSSVIEEPFEGLNIESNLETYGIGLTHPVYQSPQQIFSLGLNLERRRSETFLSGDPFSFSPGVQDGKSNVTVLRFSQNWLDRQLRQVIAFRSTFSVGIDALGATINAAAPDGQFFSWLGQFQWARRLGEVGYQLIFRTDMQLTPDSLLPLEQFAVGGARSVRGYRENQLVRDNGLVGSLEFRIPLFRLPIPGVSQGAEDGRVQLAPFADFGWAWNTDVPTPDPKTLSSVGLGIRWDPHTKLHAQLYWGLGLREIDTTEHNLQDSGLHFLVQAFY